MPELNITLLASDVEGIVGAFEYVYNVWFVEGQLRCSILSKGEWTEINSLKKDEFKPEDMDLLTFGEYNISESTGCNDIGVIIQNVAIHHFNKLGISYIALGVEEETNAA